MTSIASKMHDETIGLLARLAPKRVLLLGDLILDRYTYGKVGRISPEAPVPVLLVQEESQLPGGAGNVALNLAGLGNEVLLCARLGDDASGQELARLIQEKGHGRIDTRALVLQKGVDTPTKNRLIAAGQQLMRVDCERPHHPLDETTRAELLSLALEALDKIDIIAVSDYGKGSIDRGLLEPIFVAARKKNIPIVVDPKSSDLRLYQGATLIKPNYKEALEASNCKSTDLGDIAASIFERVDDLSFLMVTRSQDGITLFNHDGTRKDFPARVREVLDVTGAGDCVLAALVHAMACHLPLGSCCHLANIAGALAVQKIGCVQLTLKDLSRKMLHMDTHNKIFDESHLFALKEACRGECVHLIRVNHEELAIKLLLALEAYRKTHPQVLLILQVQSGDLDEDCISLLTQQHSVDLLMLMEHDKASSQIDAERTLRWDGTSLK